MLSFVLHILQAIDSCRPSCLSGNILWTTWLRPYMNRFSFIHVCHPPYLAAPGLLYCRTLCLFGHLSSSFGPLILATCIASFKHYHAYTVKKLFDIPVPSWEIWNAGTLAYSRWKIKESAELFQQHVSYFLTINTFPLSNFLLDDYRTSPIGFTIVELLRQSWNVSKVFYIRKVFLEGTLLKQWQTHA